MDAAWIASTRLLSSRPASRPDTHPLFCLSYPILTSLCIWPFLLSIHLSPQTLPPSFPPSLPPPFSLSLISSQLAPLDLSALLSESFLLKTRSLVWSERKMDEAEPVLHGVMVSGSRYFLLYLRVQKSLPSDLYSSQVLSYIYVQASSTESLGALHTAFFLYCATF